MKRGMNKFFSILLVLCMVIGMIPAAVFAASTPSTLYLKPNSNWLTDGARFAAYFFNGSGDTWASMTDSDGDGVYECSVPSGYSSVIFCRMNPGSSANNWDNKWNQTSDLAIPTDGTNCYTVANGTWDSGGGSWSTISNEPVQVDYYLFGYINGANYACEEDSANLGAYKFSSGKLTVTFDVESYVGVKTGDNANWYMTEGFQGTAKSATLINTNDGIAQPDKLYIPAGIKVTMTLTENADGTLKLSYTTTASSCQHLYYTDGVCNACGSGCSHSWSNGTCSKCGTVCSHSKWSSGKCSTCGIACDHSWDGSTCKVCGMTCSHSWQGGKCSTCGSTCTHSWTGGTCSTCGSTRSFYLFGFINGANYGCEEDAENLGSYKFSSGKLTVTFTSDSYVGIKTSDNAGWYMTKEYVSSKSATLYNTSTGAVEKMYVPGGIKVTFTLTDNGDDTLKLSYTTTASSCQHLTHDANGKCTACGSSVGHSWSDGVCSECGTACSHSYTSKVTTAATCTTSGVKTYTCSTCGDSYTETISATGHSYSNGKCSVCGAVDPNCSHSYTSEVTTAATCTATGVKTYTCSKCGDKYTETIAATGHSYSSGKCTVCGAVDATYSVTYYLVGFINGANHGCEEDSANMGSYKFSSGKLTATFSADSYVFVKTEGNEKWYLAESYCTDTTCKMVIGGTEKLYVPGGVKLTFTLTENSDGSLTVKYTADASSCSHLNHNQSGKCTACGSSVSHSWSFGSCSVCGLQCSHPSHNTSGVCSTCGNTVAHSFSGNTCTVCGYVTAASGVKIHFVDAVVWQNVTAYVWKSNSSGDTALNSWPGQVINKDANGYFTLDLDYKPTSGESLGFIFTNFAGGQTADVIVDYATLNSGEVWIKPNNWTNGDGKYDCYVTTVESSMVLSPEIHGTSVTFRYENSSASKVYIAGSMNGWSTSANNLTKDANGIWSTTMTLSEGVYEYKFVVDGEWVLDPRNGLIGGFDGNSLVIVGNAGSATATDITVKFHFYRESGDYTDWDVWMWSNTHSGAGCTLQNDATYKGKTATFTIPGGTNSYVNYVVRKTDWSDQEFYNRSFDLSNIASGTVHFFLNSGSETGSIVYGNDVIKTGKPNYANLDYNSGNIWVNTPLPVSGDYTKAFSVVKADGSASGITVTGVTIDNNGYSLALSRKPALIEIHDLMVKCGTTVAVETDGLFYSGGFAADYTYYGDDLGATWSKSGTTFKVWAPTATGVSVMLYGGGNHGADDWISTTPMTLGEKGVWSVTIKGDLDRTYYNFLVNFPTYTTEATDPYAKTTGANGDRGMIINMDAYDPEGWDQDVSPNKGMNYTDAIIYEMHIREMTIDSTSGVKDEWRGKYLGLTQKGTNYEGRATALDHIRELGVTHVQLMPTYDHAGVDEYHLTDWQQYAWGYNPKNFNVPEGSFATDPFNGEVRVTEMKQMVQAFHSNGINVVMDVVYNHTFSGGDFCYNKIVPNYFSRFWGEDNWSNGSGVGNDFATERSMARNYIIDSIYYWVEEYHIDGFRFDLAGLIDIQTINEVISTVQSRYPYVIFYGEGWAVGGTAIQDGHWTATKENAWQTGSMAFYNDSFRNDIAGDNGNSWGFATGDSGKADAIGNYFRASNGWSGSPSQTINYVSCHDNYTLIDKIIIARNGAYWDQMVKMNNMSAALYMFAQGIPYIYSGEELLREKKDEWGTRYHNTFDASDYITKIRWDDLVNKDYAQVTDDYYAGLVNFRKNHAALRCTNGGDAWGYTSYHKINDHCILFYISGYPNYECSDGIVIIYNANEGTQWLNIYDYGVPYGYWQACVHGMTAGVNPLWGTSDGSVGVEGLTTTVLVLGDLVHEESVYNNQSYNCAHAYHNQSGLCWDCGAEVSHYFVNGYCNHCNLAQLAADPVTIYYDNSGTNWSDVYLYGWTEVGGRTVTYTGDWPGNKMSLVGDNIYAATLPRAATSVIFTNNAGAQSVNQGVIKDDNGNVTQNLHYSSDGTWGVYSAACSHPGHDSNGVCTSCGVEVGHNWSNGYCSGCKTTCSHSEHSKNGLCYTCGMTVSHNWNSGTCSDCGAVCSHSWSNGKCSTCGMSCSHDYHDQSGNCYTCGYAVGHSYYGGLCSSCGVYKQGYIESQSYYLVGYINGADYGINDDMTNLGSYKFSNGTLTATFTSDSYVAVKTGDNCSIYMTDGYQDGVTSATLFDSRKVSGDKLFVPAGKTITFTLSVNSSNNTMTLSYTAADSSCTHSYSSQVTTAATCTTTGVNTFICTKCGDSYTQSIPATGHSYTDGKCYVCGAVDPNCSHSYSSSVTTAATCTASGVRTYTCSKCGDSYTESIAPTGHSYSGGSCTVCGAVDPNASGEKTYYLFGYINGANYGCEEDYENMGTYRFVDGKLTATFTADSYIGVKESGNANWYMTHGYTDYKAGIFYNTATGANEKMFVPGGVEVTFTLTENEDGSLTVSYLADTVTCKHSYTATVLSNATCNSYAAYRLTCSVCGDQKDIDASDLSKLWLYSVPSGMNSSDFTGSTAYRYRDYANGGWTRQHTNQVCYVSSWPSGFDTSNELYGTYNNIDKKVTAFENSATKVEIDSDNIAGYLYYHWCYEGYPYSVATQSGSYNRFHAYFSNVTPDEADKYDSSDNSYRFDSSTACDDCLWYFAIPVYSQVSSSYTADFGWGEWSDWSTTKVTASTTREVESGKMYRYNAAAMGSHSYANGVCTVCGAADPNASTSGYVLVTDLSQITSGGKFVIVAGSNAMGTTLSSGKFAPVSVTISGNTVTGDNLPVWDITPVSGGIAISLDGSYLNYNSSTNFKMATTAYTWTVTEGTTGYILNSSATSRGIYYSNSSAKFGAYSTTYVNSSSYVSNLQLYKYQAGSESCSHSYTSKVTTAATCTTAGVKTFTCSLCGDVYTEVIAATGHSYSGGKCTVCGAADPNASVEKTYYLFGFINNANYACEEDYENMGIYKFVDGKLTVTFSADSYVGVKTEGNATWYMTDGWQGTESTSVTLYDNTTLFTADKFYVPGGVSVTFTLTENADGSLNLSYTTDTPACSHSYTSKVTTAATCTTAGVKTYTCSKCAASYTESIPATGHSYVNGSCSVCGAKDPNASVEKTYYLFGYINNANYACEEDYENMGIYKFVDGKLTVTFSTDSYVGVKTEGNATWYMTDGWQGTESTSVTLYDNATLFTADKFYVPGGVSVTFTLTENADGSLNLSYTTGGSTTPSKVPTITLKYPTLTFEDVILMNVYFAASDLDDVVEMGLLTYTQAVTSADITTANGVIPGYTWSEADGLYYSTTNGIAAKDLGDEIYFAIYAKLADGTYTYTRVVSYSPSKYAYASLSTGSATMKPIVVAMLNYGAAAQQYFNYKTDALVNANLTSAQKALVESYRSDMIAAVASPSASKQGALALNGGFTRRYPTVSFEGAFCINYYCTPSAAPTNGITMYYWNQEDYNANSVLTLNNATKAIKMTGSGTGEYHAAVEGIAAKDLDKGVYVCFVYTSGSTTYYSGVLAYSIGAYCAAQAAGTGTGAALAQATAVYGYYANKLFN